MRLNQQNHTCLANADEALTKFYARELIDGMLRGREEDEQTDQGNFVSILKKLLLLDVFPVICWVISSSFFYAAVSSIGLPLPKEIGSTGLVLIILGVFFFLLPSAQKISIGKLLTFEQKIREVKSEVSEFKAETRDFLGVYSNMINSISNTVSHTVNVFSPGDSKPKEANDELKSTLKEEVEPEKVEDAVDTYLLKAGSDMNFALAKLRMEIERTLRKILDKKLTNEDPLSADKGFLSARQLFKQFTDKYPDYWGMHSSFDYILKICNAAIHGQKIPDNYGREALGMGIRMLKELQTLQSTN